MILDPARQCKQARLPAKLEQPVEMELVRHLSGKIDLPSTDVKRRFLAERGRLDLDEALAAICFERQDVETRSVSAGPGDMLDAIAQSFGQTWLQ